MSDEWIPPGFEWPAWPRDAAPESAPAGMLQWRAHAASSRTGSDGMETAPPDSRRFAKLLQQAGLFDFAAVPSPGPAVVLPAGVSLLRRFYRSIEDAFAAAGLSEFRFPVLLPDELLEPTARLFPVDGRILRVSRGTEPARHYLAPTGESAVYTWLARSIRCREDLPVELYQRTAYFRPVGHGRGLGVLRGMESGDVFEFHGAYTDESEQRGALLRLSAMLASLFEAWGLPVSWSLRPPWTNNRAVASAVRAADLALPGGRSIQLAALYNQGTRFSESYRIGYWDKGELRPTVQLAGYVSRRALMSLLWWNCTSDRLTLPPQWAPVQIGVAAHKGSTAECAAAAGLVMALERRAIRCERADGELRQALRRFSARGLPFVVVVRAAAAGVRFTIARGLDGHETELCAAGAEAAAGTVAAALSELEAASRVRLRTAVAGRHQAVDDLDAAAAAVMAGAVAVLPLVAAERSVQQVERRVDGEILGFVAADEMLRCAITRAFVRTRALISRRV